VKKTKLRLSKTTLRTMEPRRLRSVDMANAAGGQPYFVSGSHIKTCCWPDPPAAPQGVVL